MKSNLELIYILLERDDEAEKLYREVLNIVGGISNKEMFKKYPKLIELRQKLYKELYDDE